MKSYAFDYPDRQYRTPSVELTLLAIERGAENDSYENIVYTKLAKQSEKTGWIRLFHTWRTPVKHTRYNTF